MTARKYIDNAPATTLVPSVGTSDTIFAVTSLTGFPAAFPYSVTIDRGTPSAEVVLVTSVTGSTVTVTRNANGLGLFAHTAGASFEHTVVAQDLTDAGNHVAASTNVHGLTGGAAVVGTTQAQTLTNKTLTAPVIGGAATITGQLTGNGAMPIGSLIPFGGPTAPTGWLACDGSAVSRTTYAPLFAVIGSTYGDGNGTTTFNLPDMTARMPIGIRLTDPPGIEGPIPLGHVGGVEEHTHALSDAGWADIGFAAGVVRQRALLHSYSYTQSLGGVGSVDSGDGTGSFTTALDGFTDAGSRPPFLGLNFIIKT